MNDNSSNTQEEKDDDGTSSSQMSSLAEKIRNSEQITVFENKQLVDSNTIVDHDRIYGRDEQLAAETRAFRDTLDRERPANLLLYGPSNTGKTLTVKSVAEKVKERAAQNGIRFGFVDVNFKPTESHSLDRTVWKLGRQTATKAGVTWDIPQKGVSTDAKYDRLYEIVDGHFDALVFFLDGIDTLTGRATEDEPAYSRLLYSLNRMMAEQHVETLVSTVVATNHTKFRETLVSRTDNSYNPTEIHFSDYDTTELIEILNCRRDAFKDGAVDDGVIELAAAYGAKHEGGPRRAIDLLRGAGEIANRNGKQVVTEQHVHAANDQTVDDHVLEIVSGMALQKKLSLYAAAVVANVNDGTAPSPAVYNLYREVCQRTDCDVSTQETVNSHINKAETYGVLEREQTNGGFNTGVRPRFTFIKSIAAVIETLEEDEIFDEVSLSTARSIAQRSLRD